MIDSIPDIFFITAAAIVLLLLWAGSIAYVYSDSSKRSLSGGAQMTWLTLVSILPLVGFIAYLLLRGFARRVAPGAEPGSAPRRRFTLSRPPSGGRRGTIAGTDFYQETRPAQPAANQALRFLRKYRLSADRGPHAGTEFPVENLPARLGRGPQASIRLDKDLSVSRQHAEIYLREGELRLKDLNSSHGTQLNGRPVEDSLLRPGDRIKVGETEMIIQVEENPVP